MTDETTQPEQTPAAESTEQAPSLESLYAEYNVTAPQQPTPQGGNGQAAPSGEQQPPETNVAAIHQEMAAFRNELAAERQRRADEAVEADLNRAIATVAKESELEDKDTMVKGFLLAKASEDQRFRVLWENRGANPQAWDKALSAVAAEMRQQFAVPDPQLQENQRAMAESQRAGSTAPPPQQSVEDKALAMNPAEFTQFWGRLAGGG